MKPESRPSDTPCQIKPKRLFHQQLQSWRSYSIKSALAGTINWGVVMSEKIVDYEDLDLFPYCPKAIKVAVHPGKPRKFVISTGSESITIINRCVTNVFPPRGPLVLKSSCQNAKIDREKKSKDKVLMEVEPAIPSPGRLKGEKLFYQKVPEWRSLSVTSALAGTINWGVFLSEKLEDWDCFQMVYCPKEIKVAVHPGQPRKCVISPDSESLPILNRDVTNVFPPPGPILFHSLGLSKSSNMVSICKDYDKSLPVDIIKCGEVPPQNETLSSTKSSSIPKRSSRSPYRSITPKRRSRSPFRSSTVKQGSKSPYKSSISKRRSKSPYRTSTPKQRSKSPYKSSTPKQRSRSPYRSSTPKRRPRSPCRSSTTKRRSKSPYKSSNPKPRSTSPYRSSTSKRKLRRIESNIDNSGLIAKQHAQGGLPSESVADRIPLNKTPLLPDPLISIWMKTLKQQQLLNIVRKSRTAAGNRVEDTDVAPQLLPSTSNPSIITNAAYNWPTSSFPCPIESTLAEYPNFLTSPSSSLSLAPIETPRLNIHSKPQSDQLESPVGPEYLVTELDLDIAQKYRNSVKARRQNKKQSGRQYSNFTTVPEHSNGVHDRLNGTNRKVPVLKCVSAAVNRLPQLAKRRSEPSNSVLEPSKNTDYRITVPKQKVELTTFTSEGIKIKQEVSEEVVDHTVLNIDCRISVPNQDMEVPAPTSDRVTIKQEVVDDSNSVQTGEMAVPISTMNGVKVKEEDNNQSIAEDTTVLQNLDCHLLMPKPEVDVTPSTTKGVKIKKELFEEEDNLSNLEQSLKDVYPKLTQEQKKAKRELYKEKLLHLNIERKKLGLKRLTKNRGTLDRLKGRMRKSLGLHVGPPRGAK